MIACPLDPTKSRDPERLLAGPTAIRKLLVANRAEIAARIMRTAHGLGIATVAVYSDADADAPFVQQADEAVRLPGAAPADTYLRGDLIVAAAAATGADAVHPGYGFLSENAAFARDCTAAGLTFVGPPPDAIDAMGSKLEAKPLMEAAGVPVLPGATVTAARSRRGRRADRVAAAGQGRLRRRRARHAAGPRARRAGRRGGGRQPRGGLGVRRHDGVPRALRDDPRHVEVQIFGDAHGTVVHLFERECSIQRRYQKVIEEAPSPAVTPSCAPRWATRRSRPARPSATSAPAPSSSSSTPGDFYFLEVNTRLQVEHPVTELITGLDLVELQLRVAEGEPLPPEVTDARITGHAIEARLYAEDAPPASCRPPGPSTSSSSRPGRVCGWTPGTSGSVVGPHYDAMLAKVIAYGRTRADAARRLARALAGARLHGVTTNRDLLLGILSEPEFLAGRTDTGYLTRHDPAALGRPAAAVRSARGRGGAGRAGRAPGRGPGAAVAAIRLA